MVACHTDIEQCHTQAVTLTHFSDTESQSHRSSVKGPRESVTDGMFACRFNNGSFTTHLWVIYGSTVDHLRFNYGSFTTQLWVIYGSFMDHFCLHSGSFTAQLWIIYDSILGPQLMPQDQVTHRGPTLTHFSDTESQSQRSSQRLTAWLPVAPTKISDTNRQSH